MRPAMISIAVMLVISSVSARPDGAASHRSLLQTAPAPAPATGAATGAPAPTAAQRPAASGVVTFTASSALFYNTTAMELTGVPNVTQWVSYPPNPKSGSFNKVTFFSQALASSSNGDWLGGPQALLQGVAANGTSTSVLLALHAPMYNASTGMTMLAYKALPANETALPETGGVANSALQGVSAASVGNGQPGGLVASLAPGTVLYNVTAFLDVANIAQYTSGASDKAGLINVQLTPSFYGGYYGDGGYYNGK